MIAIHRAPLALCMVLAGAVAWSQAGNAAAQTAFVDRMAMGPGACKAAMPAFESQLRKQPLGLANVGTTSAHVTCAPHQGLWTTTEGGIGIILANHGSTTRTLTCTAVAQVSNGSYVPRSIRIPAGEERELRLYSSAWASINASCVLPPQSAVVAVRANTMYGW